MKTIAVFMILAVATEFTHAEYVQRLEDDVVANYVSRALGEKIKVALENIKKMMKTGNETLGIPKLEPLDVDHQEIDIDQDAIVAKGEVNDLHVEGLSEFTVEHADFKIAKKNLSIDLKWSNIKGKTSYDINAQVEHKYPIFGKGDINFAVKDFNFATNVMLKLDIKNKNITVLSFNNTKVLLEELKLDITGLFHDEEISKFLSGVIGDIVPDALVDLQDKITDQINQIALPIANEALKKISFDEIWGIIKP